MDAKQAVQAANSGGLQIKRAVRTTVRPLVCIYGESGTGKTYSALLLARGFVGPTGQIILGDTESGRGSLYADVIPGSYDTVDLQPPFSPVRLIEFIELVEKHASIGIVDSGSHFWEGPGGVCDMADQIEQRSGKPGLHCWREPKTQHQMMIGRFLRSSIPWIICLRAKHKSRQVKNPLKGNKTEIVKDEYSSPIQSEDFIYETTIHGETMPDHKFHRTKEAHPELCKCFPADGPIEIKHGELLAQWCKGPLNAPGNQGSARDKIEAMALKDQKRELWELTKDKHQGDKAALQQFCWDEALMLDTETLEELTADRMAQVLAKTKEKLAQ